MKKIFLLAAVSVFALGVSQVSATETTGTGNAKATIITSVKVTADSSQPLDFGEIISTVDSNDVTVDATNNTRSASLGEASLSNGRIPSAGKFKVEGSPAAAVTISSTDITSSGLTGNGDTMALDNFTVGGTTSDVLTLDTEGNGEFTVGGTLHVNAAQKPGEYEGDYTVTATY